MTDERAAEETPGAAPPRSVVRLVVAGRIVLLALAAALAVSGFALYLRKPVAGSQRLYACSMHPQITAARPSDCPICGMALVEMRAGAAPHPFEVPPPRQQGAVETVRRRVLSLEVRAPASAGGNAIVRAILAADEVATLDPGAAGFFVPAATPQAPVRVRRTGSRPEPVDASSSSVEFRLDDGSAVASGTAGWVELGATPRPVLVVPSSAVLQAPDGACVLASADGRTFARRRVEVGKIVFGLATVTFGLREGEQVATRSAFFLDAEERLAGAVPEPR